MAQTVKNLSGMQKARSQSLGQEALLEMGMNGFLPGESHEQRSLEG